MAEALGRSPRELHDSSIDRLLVRMVDRFS